MCFFIFIVVQLISVDSYKQNLNEYWSIRIIIIFFAFFFFAKSFIRESWILFVYMMKHSCAGCFFSLYVLMLIIYIKIFSWFASAFILSKPFYFIWFSYAKISLVVPNASCFSNREQLILLLMIFVIYSSVLFKTSTVAHVKWNVSISFGMHIWNFFLKL